MRFIPMSNDDFSFIYIYMCVQMQFMFKLIFEISTWKSISPWINLILHFKSWIMSNQLLISTNYVNSNSQ